jgi:hypothetical protein
LAAESRDELLFKLTKTLRNPPLGLRFAERMRNVDCNWSRHASPRSLLEQIYSQYTGTIVK